ncbi:organic cation transporter protein [Lingula anatina]|uniref:Organic cation transporter protein n=1 Tax=Lingula anatina TaxID=7574 RepID=A0A1S3J0W6_LINAN|nr:organic cation transporter protein [Lingula anatina]|eukprot:XP_013403454.1 organic cation transporter protein [Lingula anatina]
MNGQAKNHGDLNDENRTLVNQESPDQRKNSGTKAADATNELYPEIHHFDEVLQHIGNAGPYQVRIYFLLCMVAVVEALTAYAIVFIEETPKHRCQVPGLDNDTWVIQGPGHEALINASIPRDRRGKYAECTVRTSNGTEVKCSNWVYDTSTFTTTYPSQFNLVCDKAELLSVTSMVFFGSALAGGLFLGILSDTVGRKTTLVIALLGQGITGVVAIFAPTIEVYMIIRFLLGAFSSGIFNPCFTLALEFYGPKQRMVAGSVINFFCATGGPLTTLLAYFLRDWRHFQLAVTLPTFLVLVTMWYVPESPRWLLSRGKRRRAEKILRTAARVNGRVLAPNVLNNVVIEEESPSVSFRELFRAPKVILRMLMLSYAWLIVDTTYYGIGLHTGNLGGDIFVNYLCLGLIEYPAFVICFTIDRFGRKKPYILCMLLGGLACVCSIFVELYANEELKWLHVVLAVAGKFGAAAVYGIHFIWAAEIYPTVIRNFAMGVGATVANIGTMVSPFIVRNIKVDSIGPSTIPMIIFGAASISAAILVGFLPETTNINLPETLEDAQNLGRKQSTHKKKIRHDEDKDLIAQKETQL